MRRVPTSWVASGNPNSITDACIHFTQKFVKTRDCGPPGWHILQTFEWGDDDVGDCTRAPRWLVTPVGIVWIGWLRRLGTGTADFSPIFAEAAPWFSCQGHCPLTSGTIPHHRHCPAPTGRFLHREFSCQCRMQR